MDIYVVVKIQLNQISEASGSSSVLIRPSIVSSSEMLLDTQWSDSITLAETRFHQVSVGEGHIPQVCSEQPMHTC